MRYGFVMPSIDISTFGHHAREIEEAGWDGVFVWEPVWGVDAWIALTVAATATTRIRLGTMLTPVSRRRPWKLASETATLDRLSGGRVTLAVGLGATDTGFESFGEVTDRRTRAELMDEGLEILTGLWRGQPFAFDGKHYHVRETEFFPPPPPVQSPRIPVWMVGAIGRRRSMDRAARWDGLIPAKIGESGQHKPLTPEDIRAAQVELTQRGVTASFDIVAEGETPTDDLRAGVEKVRPWEEAGATWWLEASWGAIDRPDDVRKRFLVGPPRLA